MAVYLLCVIGTFLVRYLPLNIQYRLAETIGDLLFFLARRVRKNIYANITIVLGRKTDKITIERTVRKVFRNYMKFFLEVFRLPLLSKEDIDKITSAHGREHIEKALKRGKGVIVFSAHLGNWEYAAIVALRPYPTNVVMENLSYRKMFDFFRKIREAKGIRTIPLNRYAGILCEKALERNEIVAYPGERDIQKTGIPVNFFGRVTQIPRGTAFLASLTGAQVLPVYLVRKKDNSFECIIGPPVDLKTSGDREKDLLTNTQIIANVLENIIRRYPDQWCVFQPLWPEDSKIATLPAG